MHDRFQAATENTFSVRKPSLLFIVPWSRHFQKHRNANARMAWAAEPHQARGSSRQTLHLSDVSDEAVEVAAFPVSRRQRGQRCPTGHRCYPVSAVAALV